MQFFIYVYIYTVPAKRKGTIVTCYKHGAVQEGEKSHHNIVTKNVFALVTPQQVQNTILQEIFTAIYVMPTVSEFDCAKIVMLRELGQSYGKIAAEMNCSKPTAQRTFQRYTETGETADKPKSGRPKLLSPCENKN